MPPWGSARLGKNKKGLISHKKMPYRNSGSGVSVGIIPILGEADFSLYQDDCLSVLAAFPADCVDVVFADPPYRLSNGGVTCYAGQMVRVDKGGWDKSQGFVDDLAFHERWIAACQRVLKPTGTLWISGTAHSIYQCGFLLQKLDFHLLNDIIWYKPNAAPNLACTTFAHSHETLLWARKERKGRNVFNYALMKDGTFPEDKMKKAGKQMRSVWSIPTPTKGEKAFGRHPTQKPLALLKRILLASTKDGDTVLDPFNGSGTTGIACKGIGGRKYIGIEMEAAYINLTIKRFRGSVTQPELSQSLR